MFRGACVCMCSVVLVHSQFNACAAGLSSAVIPLTYVVQGSFVRVLAPGELAQEETFNERPHHRMTLPNSFSLPKQPDIRNTMNTASLH